MFEPRVKLTFDEATDLFDLVARQRDALTPLYHEATGDRAVDLKDKIDRCHALVKKLSKLRKKLAGWTF